MTTDEYLYDTEETRRKRELHYGMVREPPAPFFSHQQLVLHIARLLWDHAVPRRLGRVAVAPVDVILDAERALIVQPDVLFIAEARSSIIRNQVWGPPDLVVEVLSPGNQNHDRKQKLRWYREYGVRECWLVDPRHEAVTLSDFSVTPAKFRIVRTADGPGCIVRSTVLPDLQTTAFAIFNC